MAAIDTAVKHFHSDIERLKILKGWTDKDLASALGCSRQTIQNLKHHPARVSGLYIMAVMGMLIEEEGKEAQK